MQHELERLRRAAALLTADLHRTLGDAWLCAVEADYSLVLTGPGVREAVQLDAEIEDEEWYVRPEFSQQDQADALDAAAEDLVANETIEVFDSLGRSWPLCPQDGQVAGNCDGSWYCSASHEHDLGVVGELEARG